MWTKYIDNYWAASTFENEIAEEFGSLELALANEGCPHDTYIKAVKTLTSWTRE
jgi:hypothetical protein